MYAVYEAKKDNSTDFAIFSGWVTHVPSKQPVFFARSKESNFPCGLGPCYISETTFCPTLNLPIATTQVDNVH